MLDTLNHDWPGEGKEPSEAGLAANLFGFAVAVASIIALTVVGALLAGLLMRG